MESNQNPSEADRYVEEKEHYKSLISLFEKSNAIVERTYNRVVYVFVAVLTFVSTLVLFTTYKSVGELKESLALEKKNLVDQLESIKTQLKESQATVDGKADMMQKRVDASVSESRQIVNKAEIDAVNQIGSVRSLAEQTAKNEANKSIEKAFAQDNIQQLVEKTAKQELGSQLDNIVKREITKTVDKFDVQMEEFGKFSNAKNYADYKSLDSVRRFSPNEFSRKRAQKTLQEWTDQVYREYTPNKDGEIQKDIEAFFAEYHPEFKNYKDVDQVIKTLVKLIHEPYQYYQISRRAFVLLDIISGSQVKAFDFEGLDRWFESYKRGIVTIKPYK